jgi:HEPN domain-containing protein
VSSSDPISWLSLAKSDAEAARRLLAPPAALPQAAYFAQQSVEKAIKARLVDLRIDYPRHGGRGHDLKVLANVLPDSDPTKAAFSELSALTPWATAFRYPSDDPSTEAVLSVEELENRLDQIDNVIQALDDLLRN